MKKFLLPVLVLAIIVVVGGWFIFRDTIAPAVALAPENGYVSRANGLTLMISDSQSGLRSIRVVAKKDAANHVLLEQTLSGEPKEQTFAVPFNALNMPDGPFQLVVTVHDASWAGLGKGNEANQQWDLAFDSVPPRVSIKSPQPYVRRGGTGSVRYSLSEPASQTGVLVAGQLYPGFAQANGDYIVFFPFPHELSPADYRPDLLATDIAGNSAKAPLPFHVLDRTFKRDRINLDDRFLAAKAIEFLPEVPGDMTPLQRYLKVNGELRALDEAQLINIAKDTAPTMLWEGAFIQLPNGASRAEFAQHRTYFYNGQEVDQQNHMGLDLASVANAPIPAANAGIVVFADRLGIFGNLVVVDHGLGLQSLYSHMSEFSVKKGDVVKRGDILGKTGITGLAGGDHLHFGITVGGIQVQPLEWLDPKWIKDNVTSRLGG